jgi:hypothetical protein
MFSEKGLLKKNRPLVLASNVIPWQMGLILTNTQAYYGSLLIRIIQFLIL